MVYDRYWGYDLRESEIQILADLGRFRVINAENSLPLTCPQKKGLPVGVQETLVDKQEIGCGGQIELMSFGL